MVEREREREGCVTEGVEGLGGEDELAAEQKDSCRAKVKSGSGSSRK
jgi:hypothetical protein